MSAYTKFAGKVAGTFMIMTSLLACGQQEKKSSDSELSAQSCNYSAYEACLTDMILMSPEDRGYLAKKIKCDTIFIKCNN